MQREGSLLSCAVSAEVFSLQFKVTNLTNDECILGTELEHLKADCEHYILQRYVDQCQCANDYSTLPPSCSCCCMRTCNEID